MARQFIYHMQGLSKTYPGNRKVLENINLSFYPDAKIGVLGVNGAGKSTLLRVMAGLDKEFVGEAWAAEGARVGRIRAQQVVVLGFADDCHGRVVGHLCRGGKPPMQRARRRARP